MPNESAIDVWPPMTVSTVFLHNLFAAIQRNGVPFESLLGEVGLSRDLLSTPESRITCNQYGKLVRLLIGHLEDEMLGFLSRPLRPGTFALLVRSAVAAETLEIAIRHVSHVFRLLNDDVQLCLMKRDTLAGVALEFARPAAAAHRFVHEILLRVYWRLFAWLTGGQLPLAGFDFAFRRPTYSGAYARIFPAPWRFDAGCSALWFASSRLSTPVVRDVQAAKAFVSGAPANLIVPTRDSGVVGAVRMHLQRTQSGWPDLKGMARTLNVSPSTLQRQLASQGTSFQDVRDALRRDLAIHRLTTSAVSLTKLGIELGFADGAAFQRAFKRWTGCAAGAYRRLGR